MVSFLLTSIRHIFYRHASHLSEAGGGAFDGDLAAVVDGGPDADALAGHEASPVQFQTADDRTGAQTAHPELVLHLTVKRLLSASWETLVDMHYRTLCGNECDIWCCPLA